MVVDEGDGSNDMAVGLLPRFLYEFFANEIAKGLGAVGIAFASNERIELVE